MKITFVLPFGGKQVIGGLKIIYEYANRLSAKGHQVTVVHSTPFLDAVGKPKSVIHRILEYAGRAIGLRGGFRPNHWFPIAPLVKLLWTPSLHERWIPDSDAVIATAWSTAEAVSNYSTLKGTKFYFIQGLEVWSGDEQRVMATWRLPLKKIVISRWLQRLAEELGETAIHISNGLDFELFNLDIDFEHRNKYSIAMLYNQPQYAPHKGSKDGLSALAIVKEKHPSLSATLFGISPHSIELPPWIRYVQLPSQVELRKIYNNAAIFISPSITEGWGLTSAEAMQCGVAVCATDNGGHKEFMQHGFTALLSPVERPDLLAENILQLIADKKLRKQISTAAYEHIQQFTWPRSVTAFEQYLLQSCSN